MVVIAETASPESSKQDTHSQGDVFNSRKQETLDSKNPEVLTSRIHVASPDKVTKNLGRGASASTNHREPVATSTSQIMSYVTVRNIETDTSYLQGDWPIFVLKELIDNAYDWLNACYPASKSTSDKEIRKIGVRLWITSDGNNNFVHIAVLNSNANGIQAFSHVKNIFDYHSWYSTKRYQHNMTTGSLGDALKRCLGMGYALYTNDFKFNETFEDNPNWNEPVIIRVNGLEFKVFIKVDNSIPDIWTEILESDKPSRDIGNDTEVEVTLPLSIEKESCLEKLKTYYQRSKIAKRNISFDFFAQELQ